MTSRSALLALLSAAALPVAAAAAQQPVKPTTAELARWATEAKNTDIIRDDWGIAHVHGKTDADAVFGMEYTQAEDDFNRVETNYINAMGRLAETEGEGQIWRDLREKLFVNTDSLKAMYGRSPAYLQKLMNAFADGLNYYLYKHPEVHPRVITHFEPWMALSFPEGSIGGDIERVNLNQLAAFYGNDAAAATSSGGASDAAPSGDGPDDGPDTSWIYHEPTGSNGIAISAKNTVDHHALLLINPHTSFYFRSELQMSSDEGLDAYGAVTWGQFFIYQGFNPHLGWMHTSSGVDAVDEFLETISKKGDRYYYKYGAQEKPVRVEHITVPYRTTDGSMAARQFTVYYTGHGPIVRKIGDQWVAEKLMNIPITQLIQSYTRTKAKNLKEYTANMNLHANSSNNTIYADDAGNIAYWHGDYIPRRDTSFDYTKPVDGSNPKTDWHGILSLAETPQSIDPSTGFIYNSNNWPWSVSGAASPKRQDFPAYVEMGREESPRGEHALRLLTGKTDFTMERLRAAAYDSYLPAFSHSIPPLLAEYDSTPDSNPVKAKVADQIAMLRTWDYRWGAQSVPTTLAIYWATEYARHSGRGGRGGRRGGAAAAPETRLQALAAASDQLTADFGSWKTPWGDINRFQRINDDIDPHFDDNGPSIPVPFVSSQWGSLASFGARPYPNTKKWYGTSGNSFVAVVEFTPTGPKAIAVTAGGESGDPNSKHFNDEAERYASGNLRDVYFYPAQLKGHTEREYHPGG